MCGMFRAALTSVCVFFVASAIHPLRVVGAPPGFMMSSDVGGVLLLPTREALCRFGSISVVCGLGSKGRLTLPLDIRCTAAGGVCEWEFTRTGIGEPARSSGWGFRNFLCREPLSSRSVDDVKMSVAERGDGRTEVEISCGRNSLQGVCVYRRKGVSWYRVLPCGDVPRVEVPNLGAFAAGDDLRVLDGVVPVTLWMPDPVAPNAERARRIVLVTRHAKTGGLSHAVYRDSDGLWVLAQVVYWGEQGVDSSGNWSPLRALGCASEMCERLFPFRGTERKSSCKLLGRSGGWETGVVRGVWETSDGVRAWFALEGPKAGVVAVAISTDEASAAYPEAVPDRAPGIRPDECLFLENDGRDISGVTNAVTGVVTLLNGYADAFRDESADGMTSASDVHRVTYVSPSAGCGRIVPLSEQAPRSGATESPKRICND